MVILSTNIHVHVISLFYSKLLWERRLQLCRGTMEAQRGHRPYSVVQSCWLWPVSWSPPILRTLTFPICSPFVHVSNDLSHISCVSLHNIYIIVYVIHRYLHRGRVV